MTYRVVAITHGDPRAESNCGRPLHCETAKVDDPVGQQLVYVCPIHGPVRDKSPFAYSENDVRPRKPNEYHQ